MSLQLLERVKGFSKISCFFFICCNSLLIYGQDTLSIARQDTISLVTGLEAAPCDNALIEMYLAPGSPVVNVVSGQQRDEFYLSEFLPKVLDQGSFQGACTAFSVAAALTIQKNRLLNKRYYIPTKDEKNYYSPSYIFNIGKSRYPADLRNNCEKGISFSDAFLVAREYGMVSLEKFPYNPASSSSCYIDIPSPELRMSGAKNQIFTFQRPNINVNTFKHFLNEGYPICVAVYVDEEYKYAGKYKLNNSRWTKKGTGVVSKNGRHALLVVGYNESIRCFKVLDSRGDSWGDNGYIWLGYDLVSIQKEVIYDAYICSFDDEVLNAELPVTADSEIPSFEPTWLKEGFYRTFNGVRIVCVELDKKSGAATFHIKDNKTLEYITNPFQLKGGEDKVFRYNNLDYLIKGSGNCKRGNNPFKQAFCFEFGISNGSIKEEFK